MSVELSADFWTELSAEFAIYFTADLKRICDGRHGGFYDGFYSGFDGANVSEIRFPSDVRGHFHDGFYVRINFAPPHEIQIFAPTFAPILAAAARQIF